MSTITTISKSVGANRIVPTVAIPYPVGNPKLSSKEEEELKYSLVKRAVDALTVEVTGVTEFEGLSHILCKPPN